MREQRDLGPKPCVFVWNKHNFKETDDNDSDIVAVDVIVAVVVREKRLK